MNGESLRQLGVSFLQNASTQNLPFSEQVKFLEGKGLSSEDIKQALQSVSVSPPAKKDGWLWSIMFPVAIIGAGCTAYVLSKAMEEDVSPLHLTHNEAICNHFVIFYWGKYSLYLFCSILLIIVL
jgi:hypothetical protein